jgi:predicted O-methyltransferase YrrM
MLLKTLGYLRDLPWHLRFQVHRHGNSWNHDTHMTPSERLLLYQLALHVPQPAVILEIGSYVGASACFLGAAASERKGIQVHCVDTWTNEAMSEGTRDTYLEFLKNTQRYRNWLTPHRGRSEDVSRTFELKLDMLFIDGDHSYEGCSTDTACWLPKVKTCGIVAFHDYGWSAGVQRVVNEWVMPIATKQRSLPNLFVGRLKQEFRSSVKSS